MPLPRFVLPSLSFLLLASCAGGPAGMPVSDTVRLRAVGDIMLSRGVDRRARLAGDAGYPFRALAGALKGTDVLFGNLECPLSAAGKRQPKGFAFLARPKYARILKEEGFSVLGVANNHAWDYGPGAFAETLRCLDEAGLQSVGVAAKDGSCRPLLTRTGNLSFAWLAYCDPGVDEFFSGTRTGSPDVSLLDPGRSRKEVERAARKADVVIVSLHWGAQYKENVHGNRVKLARQLVDRGSRLVLGHHPHVLQGIEAYEGALIAYSLGNFIFDQKPDPRNDSVILDVTIGESGVVAAEVKPVVIVESQPRLASGDKAREILERLKTMSLELGTTLLIDPSFSFARVVLPSPERSR